ncbi:tRNA (guanosine(37)-N1)-methyltransferase TrmD [Microbacterium telephonicum]|uniref:tRNA (guanine-N(1)-)-methyltransferase n=1 Tax=Microbacterium telephonicum TaxID=1714841 RepID=A0A498C4A5_9MICO|nr:tRNA (guanosine(37)-N1)-methyltransferase TrmD [Microbacterium telephonicum]RLK49346.1 tRNA (guanine37-N(1)-) methyltransferase [Microbacterium telephonicum]
MRIDVVSIFPAFFDVLEVSLLGKARGKGLLDIRVHDLRDHAHGKHRSVDDTPYGGGAGMVMSPEPWGEVIDAIAADAPDPVFVFPSPAGEVFTQATARELADEPHLVFGCGRYEGIDERVFAYAATRGRVRLMSLGDYVLNGGEVASMAMIEAIGRLVPGVVGNPESLVEESHEAGLLEYPSYTKPASWRGYDVPEILLSGHHGRVAQWRHEQQVARTRERRPDLLAD